MILFFHSLRSIRKTFAVSLVAVIIGAHTLTHAFAETASASKNAADALAVWLADHEVVLPSDVISIMQSHDQPLDFQSIALVAERVSRADARVAELLETLSTAITNEDFAEFHTPPDWLEDLRIATPAANVIRIHVAGTLHAHEFYEEALSWLAPVDTQVTLVPHLVLYYRATAAHQLVKLELADASAEALLQLSNLPRRHEQAARLILRDTQDVQPDSLDHIGRRMADIRRRLALGRTAEPEQELQQEVLDALDKMIEAAEKQQQQQQQQQASANSQPSQGKAAERSKPSDFKGPGEVDPREVAKGDNWGSLPPKERERVLQQIGRDFPSHYRGLISAYFQSLAQSPDRAGRVSPPPTETSDPEARQAP